MCLVRYLQDWGDGIELYDNIVKHINDYAPKIRGVVSQDRNMDNENLSFGYMFSSVRL
jgi:hypothetical protein